VTLFRVRSKRNAANGIFAASFAAASLVMVFRLLSPGRRAVMRQNLRSPEPEVWRGAVAGAVAGLVASWVMTRFHVALSGRGLTGSENPQSNKPVHPSTSPPSTRASDTGNGPDDAAMKTAEEAAQVVLDRPLTRGEKTEIGGPLAHYAFGASAGVIYGMLRETERAPGGAAFGAELWVVADQLGLPVAGLSPWPLSAYPASTNAQDLMAHIVYGLTTAGIYTLVGRAI
jgi:putative membrane protein